MFRIEVRIFEALEAEIVGFYFTVDGLEVFAKFSDGDSQADIDSEASAEDCEDSRKDLKFELHYCPRFFQRLFSR